MIQFHKPASAHAEHVVSVSGGKDSAATYLVALERGRPFRAVMADTGNEDPRTYESAHNLSRYTGGPEVEMVKADFSRQIAGKRVFVAEKWPDLLARGTPGRWVRAFGTAKAIETVEAPDDDLEEADEPLLNGPGYEPANPEEPCHVPGWKWVPAVAPMPERQIHELIARVLAVLHPTGNPFLDLCLWKTRFPSTKVRFCTEELKIRPMWEQIQFPLMLAGKSIVSWQGVRAAESRVRATLPRWQRLNPPYGMTPPDGLSWEKLRAYAYRPLLSWSVEDVFAMADKHGVPRNPLYAAGMSRVGCMPCIHARKDELRAIAARFPQHIDRIEEWEAIVRAVAKRGTASFMAVVSDPLVGRGVSTAQLRDRGDHGIRDMVDWSRTSRGGLQKDMFLDPAVEFGTSCGEWGACE